MHALDSINPQFTFVRLTYRLGYLVYAWTCNLCLRFNLWSRLEMHAAHLFHHSSVSLFLYIYAQKHLNSTFVLYENWLARFTYRISGIHVDSDTNVYYFYEDFPVQVEKILRPYLAFVLIWRLYYFNIWFFFSGFIIFLMGSWFPLVNYVKGSWIVRQSVGSTPCLLGKAVDCNYIRGPKYLEVKLNQYFHSIDIYALSLQQAI